MNDIRPEGHLSMREFATVCGLSEAHTRLAVADGRVSSVKLGQRRWIPISEVIRRHADLLASPLTREATLEWLHAGALTARVELLSDEDLVHNARLYLNARDAEPMTDIEDVWGPSSVKWREPVTSGN